MRFKEYVEHMVTSSNPCLVMRFGSIYSALNNINWLFLWKEMTRSWPTTPSTLTLNLCACTGFSLYKRRIHVTASYVQLKIA